MSHKETGARIAILLVFVPLIVTFGTGSVTLAQIFSDTDTVSVTSASGYPGDTLALDFNLFNTFAVGGFLFRVTYDSGNLTADTLHMAARSQSFDLFGGDFGDLGVAAFFGTSLDPVNNSIMPGSGPVASVDFVIGSYALPGIYEINFEDVDSFSHENALSNCRGDSLVIPIFVTGQIEVRSTGVADDESVMPKKFQLAQNYPNPFNAQTSISFTLEQAETVDLAVYDLLGRKVATLYSGPAGPGETSVVWNGKNELSEDVVSGVYYYRLDVCGGDSRISRMTLLK